MKIAIIGTGYVGLPLALKLAEFNSVVCFDINSKKILNLQNNIDESFECTKDQLILYKRNGGIFTDKEQDIKSCDFYIVTVPTPVDKSFKPDLRFLEDATKTISMNMKQGSIVVYESTVYPGTTEDVCLPILEESGLKINKDFWIGYSPERIVPGPSNKNDISSIKKIVSGSDKYSGEKIEELYSKIISAGVHVASSIKVAEAAKVLENIQRDVNIALINEATMFFDKYGISSTEVLEAAETKWNFHKYQPGLVGGHCIGIDPYYLIYKADSINFDTALMKTARSVNEYYPRFISEKIISLIGSSGKVCVLGLTFKENCPDDRNSKAYSIVENLLDNNIEVVSYDPFIQESKISSKKYKHFHKKSDFLYELNQSKIKLAVHLVAHSQFKECINELHDDIELFDIKSIYKEAKYKF